MYYGLIFILLAMVIDPSASTVAMACRNILGTPDAFKCCRFEGSNEPLTETGKEIVRAIVQCEREVSNATCEIQKCIGKKLKYSDDEGKVINKEIYEKYSAHRHNIANPRPFELIKKNCIYNDVSRFGLPLICELLKMELCTFLQYLLVCNKFEESPFCNQIKDRAEECRKRSPTLEF